MVQYEWSIEFLDVNAEVTHSDFAATLSGLKHQIDNANGEAYAIVLVRDTVSRGSVTERHWAYVVLEELPTTFFDANESPAGIAIPARFRKELATYLITNKL